MKKSKFKFSVPVVGQTPAGIDEANAVGSIVYDISAQGFKGLFQDGSSGPITPGSLTPPNEVLYIRVKMVGGGGTTASAGAFSGAGGSSGGYVGGTGGSGVIIVEEYYQ